MVSENGRASRISRRLSVKEFIEAAAFDGVVIEASLNESPHEPEQGKEDAASGAPAELGWLKIAMICSGTTLLFFDWGSDIMVLVSVAEQHDTARISAMAIILVLPALCMSLRDWLFPAPGQTTKLWFVFKLAMNLTQLRVVFEVSRSFRQKQVTMEYTMLKTLLALLESFPQVPLALADYCSGAQPTRPAPRLTAASM